MCLFVFFKTPLWASEAEWHMPQALSVHVPVVTIFMSVSKFFLERSTCQRQMVLN